MPCINVYSGGYEYVDVGSEYKIYRLCMLWLSGP
jgi:hypothetical protein